MSENNQSNTYNDFSMASLPKVGRGSACGKAIIVGEHAVVYGAHAVAMPLLQIGMELEVRPHLDDLQSDHFRLKLSDKVVSERIAEIIPDAFRLIDQEFFPLTMKGHSSIPMGAGLGSSATLCIAALRSILDSCSQSLSRDEIAEMGNRMERRFHGNPSGLDTAVIAYEECVYFAREQTINPIKVNGGSKKKWHFALIDSKIRASTMAMIKIAEPYFKCSQGDRRIDRFDLAAQAVKTALPHHDYQIVASAMEECGALLVEAGVVPPSILDMLSQCHQLGVPAAKTTGAGGGGTIICLLECDQWSYQYQKIKEHFVGFPTFHICF